MYIFILGKDHQEKLEDRARKCIMLGYVQGGKGWLFYDEKTKTVFASAIAKFLNEEGSADDTEASTTN